MKVTHYHTMTKVYEGHKSMYGRINKKTRSIALCDRTVSPRKSTKDWNLVTCKQCLKRKVTRVTFVDDAVRDYLDGSGN